MRINDDYNFESGSSSNLTNDEIIAKIKNKIKKATKDKLVNIDPSVEAKIIGIDLKEIGISGEEFMKKMEEDLEFKKVILSHSVLGMNEDADEDDDDECICEECTEATEEPFPSTVISLCQKIVHQLEGEIEAITEGVVSPHLVKIMRAQVEDSDNYRCMTEDDLNMVIQNCRGELIKLSEDIGAQVVEKLRKSFGGSPVTVEAVSSTLYLKMKASIYDAFGSAIMNNNIGGNLIKFTMKELVDKEKEGEE